MSASVALPLQCKVADVLGWKPASWTRVHGGYTPAARYVVRGGPVSAFVKIATNPVTAAHMHREIAVYDVLSAPFTPKCYGWSDDADCPFLVIEDLSSAIWPPPWSLSNVAAVLDRVTEMHAVTAPLRRYAEVHGARELGWRSVAADPTPFLSLGLAGKDWLARSLPVLKEAEAACSTAGNAVTHWDLRSDNICFAKGKAIFIDWGEACLSNPKLDLGFWLPSLAYEGGPMPEEILPDSPEVAAWVSGFFAARAGLPDVPNAPFVRRVQKEQLSASLRWVCRVLGLQLPQS
jgi:aminoglycoside phosphotransferase (APT) family kinase protein